MRITGIATIRNAFEVGYPFVESLLSIYPIVDEYFINDGGSNDGTLETLQHMERVFRKIKLYNIPDYPGCQWECIDNSINIMKQDAADWLFESQADEVFHEETLLTILAEIKWADRKGFNSIRYKRIEVFNLDCNDSIDYRVVRAVKNLPDLTSNWGGDDFQLKDQIRYAKGTTSHYVPPEWRSSFVFYHIEPFVPLMDYKKAIRHAKYLAINHPSRMYILNRLVHKYQKNKPTIFNITPSPQLPFLIRSIDQFDKYRVREELFDIDWLNKHTGLDYS